MRAIVNLKLAHGGGVEPPPRGFHSRVQPLHHPWDQVFFTAIAVIHTANGWEARSRTEIAAYGGAESLAAGAPQSLIRRSTRTAPGYLPAAISLDDLPNVLRCPLGPMAPRRPDGWRRSRHVQAS